MTEGHNLQDEPQNTSKKNELLLTALWKHCNLLLEEGLTYDDYAQELGYLLFLKIADEQTKRPFDKPSIVPHKYAWQSLLSLQGLDLLNHYRSVIEALRQDPGLPGVIFRKAKSRIDNPAQLHQLIMLIDSGIWYSQEPLIRE